MAEKCPLHGHPMPLDDAYFANPWAAYAQWREQGPVHRCCLPDGVPVWAVTGYDEVRTWLLDQRLARARRHANADYTNEAPPEGLPAGVPDFKLVMQDPPEHTETRRLVNFAFVPRRVAAMRPTIEALVDRRLDELAERGAGGAVVDLVDLFCAPLPIAMMSELLGVPESEWDNVRRWNNDIFGRTDEQNQESAVALAGMLRGLIAARRAEPREDLISLWAQAKGKDGQILPETEVMLLVIIMYTGGFDAAVGTLAACTVDLVNHPEHAAKLVANPDLVPAAVEELLRRNNASQRGFRRFATEDLAIAGQRIGAGDTVLLYIGAAGRDPRQFPDPDAMDFERAENPHLSFGRGPHHCPASELARMELRIALPALFSRFSNIRLAIAEEEIEWRRSTYIRVPYSLPVILS